MPNFISCRQISECSGARVAVDTETDGLYWYANNLIGVGIHCPDRNISGYFPVHNDRDFEAAQDAIAGWEDGTTLIFHNAKFDLHFLGIRPRLHPEWKIIDTSVLIHLYDSRLRKSLDLAERYFLGTSSKRHHVTSAPPRTKVWEWPIDTIADYCENDCIVTYQLAEKLYPMVVRGLGLRDIFWQEMEYMKVIWDAERRGILTDPGFIERSMTLQEFHMHDLETELYESCGLEFNWRSPQQLSKAIYDGLGIPKPKNPFAGADGIDRSRFADAGLYKSTCTSTFLLTEKVKHPLGELIAALRESHRMIRMMDGYMNLADSAEVVHTTFNQTGTRTGRLSSSRPNMQNVPSQVRGRFTQSVYTGDVRRAAEYNLRNAFVARPGYQLLSVDWKQMEMRMFGILAQDEFMMNALASGKDIHAEVAQKVWGVVDKVHREWSKTIGFGLIYGMTIGSLMFKLNQTKQQAAVIRDQYLREFPRIMPWMNEVIAECRAFGYVRYWNGRLWREDNPIDMYKGANAQIQGGCAEILKTAALRTDEWCRRQGDHRIVSFVHDEIMFEVPEEDVERSAKELMQIMEVPDLFPVPFFNDAKSGTTYGNQEALFEREKHKMVFWAGGDSQFKPKTGDS